MIEHEEQVDAILDGMGIKDLTTRAQYHERWKVQIGDYLAENSNRTEYSQKNNGHKNR